MALLHIAGAALNQTPLDWEGNLKNILTAIQEAKKRSIDILCLPELCITGYGCEDWFLSEYVPEKALAQLIRIVPHCQNMVVAVGLPMRVGQDTYNCACLIADGEILGFSAKQFLANEGVHYEPRWFKAWQPNRIERIVIDKKNFLFGDLVYLVRNIKIGFEICEDAWHKAQRPAFRHAKKGVDLILNPSASHFAFGKSTLRQAVILEATQSISCAYIYANLLGNEAGRMIYDGEILIAYKNTFLQANSRFSFQDVNIASVQIDLKTTKEIPTGITCVQENKNIDFAQAVALGLFDYVRKSRSKGFVLSLSGGADSATCAVLVAEMAKRGITELGLENFLKKIGYFSPQEIQQILEDNNGEILKKNINNDINEVLKKVMPRLLTCVYQSSDNSSFQTLQAARTLANSIHAVFFVWSIADEVISYSKKIEYVIGRQLTWELHDIALQNIQARARSPIIWMLANVKNALLITTSNRSEGSVGYATMDGDTSGSIAPIAGVDKHFIRQWLKFAQNELGYYGLKAVNQLVPTAELRPKENAQTDEKDLMPYEVLQAIEYEAIRNHASPKQVFEKLKTQNLENETLLKQHIVKFFQLWARNQWKRERLAPSFHLDDYSIDSRSWCRFPILSGAFQQEIQELIDG
ncbi:MAG: NAD(+) synthase [Microscillaceae bacterium]|nr:NAD(+) synthase [Microscillaceae bacterium]MDW8460155.1 NAD(+) synthase [Cytophagales bacterium]